jgi:hypothetical protein
VRPAEAEAAFRSLLEDAGVALGGPFDSETAGRAWEGFKRFAAMPVDGMSTADHSDALLFQAGNANLRDPHFRFGMLRQLTFSDEDGEYEGMEQIECSFVFGGIEEPLAVTVWSIEVPEGEFFEWVEETPASARLLETAASRSPRLSKPVRSSPTGPSRVGANICSCQRKRGSSTPIWIRSTRRWSSATTLP